MLQILIYSFLIITAINITAYFWAYKNQSDHLTDISYSACFIGLVLFLYLYKGDYSMVKTIAMTMVILWGVRLGSFLYYRIKKMGKDDRFDDFRGNWLGFLKFWILQSVSIWIIALPVMIFLAKSDYQSPLMWAIVIWLIGWIMETIADAQKFNFKQKYPDSFISYGLYSKIRHPNYLGEILVWTGIFLYVAPSLHGWEWIAVISPLWIITLLLFISGIPLVEEKHLEKYGKNPEFQAYKKNTCRLLPFVY